jgi:hypothetical protein
VDLSRGTAYLPIESEDTVMLLAGARNEVAVGVVPGVILGVGAGIGVVPEVGVGVGVMPGIGVVPGLEPFC